MTSEPEVLVRLFHDGACTALVRAATPSASYFGGPFGGSVGGKAHGPRRLHHVATISGVPLLYGLRFDGCRLRYRYDDAGVEILELDPPESSEDWRTGSPSRRSSAVLSGSRSPTRRSFRPTGSSWPTASG